MTTKQWLLDLIDKESKAVSEYKLSEPAFSPEKEVCDEATDNLRKARRLVEHGPEEPTP